MGGGRHIAGELVSTTAAHDPAPRGRVFAARVSRHGRTSDQAGDRGVRGGTQDRTILLPGVGNSLTKGRSARSCAIAGCGKLIRARNWCAMHYQRWWVHGGSAQGKQVGHAVEGAQVLDRRLRPGAQGARLLCHAHAATARARFPATEPALRVFYDTGKGTLSHGARPRSRWPCIRAARGGPAVSARARTRVSIGSGLPVRRAQAAASEKP